MARNIIINPNRGLTGATTHPEIRFSGATSGGISLKVEDDGSLTFEGSTGGLFSIEDDKDGLLHGVSDVSGLPIFSVYSDNRVEMGKWDDLAMTIADNQVFIGPSATTVSLLHISGGSFTYKDGNETLGYVMTSDASGIASWGATLWVSGDSGTQSFKSTFGTGLYNGGDYSMVAAGRDNIISGTTSLSDSIIVGGNNNLIESNSGVSARNGIFVGQNNVISGAVINSTIMGGISNTINHENSHIIGLNGITTTETGTTYVQDLTVIGTRTVMSDSFRSSDIATFGTVSKGAIMYFDTTGSTSMAIVNANTTGKTSLSVGSSVAGENGAINYYGSTYLRGIGTGGTGNDFYQNKVAVNGGTAVDGMIIKPVSNDAAGILWFEMNAQSVGILNSDAGYWGFGLNQDGTELPTSHLQIGGTGTTGTFKFLDGNESANKIMVSDSGGTVSWAPLVWTGNTSGDCITDIYATNIIGCSPLNLNNSMTVEDNGNVGIGTLTADTTLHVVGDMTLEGQNFYVDNVNSTNDIRFRATDSVGHPYYTAFGFGPTGQENQISTDSTVGFQIGLGTSNRFRFTSTSATHLALTLNGSLLGFDFASNTAITSHRFGTVGAEGGKVWLNAQGYTTGDVQIEGGSDANLLFTDASTDRVGIGTATPTAKLHVKGTGDTSASNTFLLQNSGGTTTMVVEDGGNVGIGEATPTAAKLVVQGLDDIDAILQLQTSGATAMFKVNAAGAVFITGTATTTFTNNGRALFSGIVTVASGQNIRLGSSLSTIGTTTAPTITGEDGLTFSTRPISGGIAQMTIAKNGEIGIGDTTPDARLHVVGLGDNSTSDTFLLQNSGGTTTMVVEDGGNVGIGTAAPTDTLHVNGVTGSTQFRLEQSFTPSSSGDTAGNVGSVAWDDTYLYTKTNTGWGRTIWDYTF